MDFNQFGTVRIVIGEEDEVVDVSLPDLSEKVAEVASTHRGEMHAFADAGPRPLWHRLLGASRYIQSCFLLRWQGAAADLMLFDENNSEYRAILLDADPTSQLGEEAFPLAKELALTTLRDFIATGRRPDYLQYRFSK